MRPIFTGIILLCCWLALPAQCPDFGITDNCDPQINSVTFADACLESNSTGLLIFDWLMNINLNGSGETDANQFACTAPARSWGIKIEFPEFDSAYEGVPYSVGNLENIQNGQDFDWGWDEDLSILTGISNTDMTFDIIQANSDSTYRVPGGEVAIPIKAITFGSCENIFSHVSIFILDADEPGACDHAFVNESINDFQESSMGTKMSESEPLFQFQIQRNGCHDVTLDWETEMSVHGFEIQRSLTSSDQFERIGWVDGDDNPSGLNQYAFQDRLLSKHAGKKIYYRLKQLEPNGTESYSEIKSTIFDCSDLLELDIFPNPVTRFIQIKYENDHSGITEIQIVDYLGQVIRSVEVQEINGKEIDVTDLNAGVYHLNFRGPEKQTRLSKQFIKVKY